MLALFLFLWPREAADLQGAVFQIANAGNTATWVDYLYRGMLGRHATAAEKRAVVAYVALHGKAAAVKTVPSSHAAVPLTSPVRCS